MIVCHCRAVSDRTIRACARAGVTTVEGVAQMTGAAMGCGGCAELVEDVLEEEHGRRSDPCLSSCARKLPIVSDSFSDVA